MGIRVGNEGFATHDFSRCDAKKSKFLAAGGAPQSGEVAGTHCGGQHAGNLAALRHSAIGDIIAFVLSRRAPQRRKMADWDVVDTSSDDGRRGGQVAKTVDRL